MSVPYKRIQEDSTLQHYLAHAARAVEARFKTSASTCGLDDKRSNDEVGAIVVGLKERKSKTRGASTHYSILHSHNSRTLPHMTLYYDSILTRIALNYHAHTIIHYHPACAHGLPFSQDHVRLRHEVAELGSLLNEREERLGRLGTKLDGTHTNAQTLPGLILQKLHMLNVRCFYLICHRAGGCSGPCRIQGAAG